MGRQGRDLGAGDQAAGVSVVIDIEALRALVAEQAKDPGLWFIAETAPEAYLQEALRALHRAIEGDKEAGK